MRPNVAFSIVVIMLNVVVAHAAKRPASGDYRQVKFEVQKNETWLLHQCLGGYAASQESASSYQRFGGFQDVELHEIVQAPDGRKFRGVGVSPEGAAFGVRTDIVLGGRDSQDIVGRVLKIDFYDGDPRIVTEQAIYRYSVGKSGQKELSCDLGVPQDRRIGGVRGGYLAVFNADGSFRGITVDMPTKNEWQEQAYTGVPVHSLQKWEEEKDGNHKLVFTQTIVNGKELKRPRSVTVRFSPTDNHFIVAK